jgi:uridine kinase
VARAILSALDHIPTVLILSQDSFYRRHTPEEIKLAFDNDLDLGKSQGVVRKRMSADTSVDHPDSIDTALFAKVAILNPASKQ